MTKTILQFADLAWEAARAAFLWIVDKFKNGDFWAIGGTLATIAALIVGYRQLRRTPPLPNPIPELRIWDHGDRYIEGYLTLHNHAPTTATIDLIKVIRPRHARIGWPDIDAPHHGRRFKEPIGYVVLLRVEPGKSAGVGMLIELPEKQYPPTRVSLRARLSTQDRRRPIMIDCTTTIIETAIKPPTISGITAQPQTPINATRTKAPRTRYDPLAKRPRYNPITRRVE